MKVLERTIFKKKNDEIKELQSLLEDVSSKSAYNYERNTELKNKIDLLEAEKERLENKIHQTEAEKESLNNRIRQINGTKGAYIKQINRLNKIYQETTNALKNDIKELKNELKETKLKLEESMSNKYRVRKIRAATGKQKKPIGIKRGYVEGKIISKIKEKV